MEGKQRYKLLSRARQGRGAIAGRQVERLFSRESNWQRLMWCAAVRWVGHGAIGANKNLIFMSQCGDIIGFHFVCVKKVNFISKVCKRSKHANGDRKLNYIHIYQTRWKQPMAKTKTILKWTIWNNWMTAGLNYKKDSDTMFSHIQSCAL